MKKMLTCLLALMGLTSACGQKDFEDADVNGFAELIANQDVVIFDVRTASEFAEGHIEGAINIDYKQGDFVERSKATLPKDRIIAVYCRSGRRSAGAADLLAKEGFKLVNLKGGIIAWQEAKKPVTTDTYEVDVFKTKSGKTVKFHALMHGSIRMEYDGKEIEIDPVSKLRERIIDFSKMPKADYIFVTHEHMDHFDKVAIEQLSKEGTLLITNKNCADMLGYGIIMKNGDSRQMSDDFTVEAVPAYNTTEANRKFHPRGRDNGFILTIDGLRIYIAGDTEDIPEMADIKDIDIAFMPCNQPYTMTPEQLVKAAKTVRPKVLFPYHYGETNVKDIPEKLKEEGIDVRIRHYE
jgi:L-ascorbate metabolism protein UlaG (beta-lactamase superfamily)/rhodanese-related sulfurtransferase